VQLHIHAVEFDYLCQSIEPATVMLGNPGCSQLPVDSFLMEPQKVAPEGPLFGPSNRFRVAENLVLPLYRIVVQHMKNQILTEVTAEVAGAAWSAA
jgi:hypothetical protein